MKPWRVTIHPTTPFTVSDDAHHSTYKPCSIVQIPLLITVQRVRKTALSIAGALPAKQPDLLVVELAALLHDVLDKKYVSESQAADAYAYFLPFFHSLSSEHGFDLISDGRARQIVKVIENVSWTTEKKLRDAGKIEEWHNACVELHCVQDADRLDAIGAFGKLCISVFVPNAFVLSVRQESCDVLRTVLPRIGVYAHTDGGYWTLIRITHSALSMHLQVVTIRLCNTSTTSSCTSRKDSKRSQAKRWVQNDINWWATSTYDVF